MMSTYRTTVHRTGQPDRMHISDPIARQRYAIPLRRIWRGALAGVTVNDGGYGPPDNGDVKPGNSILPMRIDVRLDPLPCIPDGVRGSSQDW